MEQVRALDLPHLMAWGPWCKNETFSIAVQSYLRPLSRLLRRAVIEFGPDLIDVHMHNAWLSGLFLPIPKLATAQVRATATFHGFGRQRWRYRFLASFHRHLARKLSSHQVRLSTVESGNLADIQSILGLPRELFTVVHNGVPATEVRGCPTLRQSQPFTVGFLGNVCDGKGWQITAEAVVLLREQGIPVNYLIAGAVWDKPSLERWLRSGSGNIKYAGLVDDVYRNFFAKVDLLVLPGESEGMPMSLLEAMASAVPALATPVGGVPAVIKDGRNGFIIDRSPATIGEKLRQLVPNQKLLKTLSENAFQTWEMGFTMEHCGRNYESLYNLVLRISTSKFDYASG